MKKQITLSLLIISSSLTHAMENTCHLDSFSFSLLLPAWFPFNQVQHTPSLVSNLRANKNKFEDQLRISQIGKRDGIRTLTDSVYRLNPDNLKTNPSKFLRYCYYYQHWYQHRDMMQLKDLDIPLLETCHKAQIDGYSALGVAIMQANIFLIPKLITYGFKPTRKDIGIAELMLYDSIPTEQKKTTILFLCDYQEDNLSQLLPEIRKQIAQYMIQLFKNEFWLLPESTSNDL